MYFSDIINNQIKLCAEQLIKKRRSAHVAGEKPDLIYEINGWSVVISEVRKLPWHLGKIRFHKVRVTFDTRYFRWKLYYQENKKWTPYPDEPVSDFSDVIKVVEEDVNGYFFD